LERRRFLALVHLVQPHRVRPDRRQTLNEKHRREAPTGELIANVPLCLWDSHGRQFPG
jgi:hypothetical protein